MGVMWKNLSLWILLQATESGSRVWGCCVMIAISSKLGEVSWIASLAGNKVGSFTSRLKHWAWASLVTVAPYQVHWQEDEAPTPTKLPVIRAASFRQFTRSHTIYVF